MGVGSYAVEDVMVVHCPGWHFGQSLSILGGERDAGVITFGYSDDEAFAVGLTCGGTIRLFIEELDW